MKPSQDDIWDLDDVLSQAAIHTVFGEIDEQKAEDCVKFVLAQNHINKKRRHMTMIVNSEGGDLNHAFAMIDVIQHSQMPVHMLGIGQISSSGLMIFMAGAKGYRTLTPNTSIMSHQWRGAFDGKVHELVSVQEDWRLTSQRVMNHYVKCSGLTESEIHRVLLPASDVYLTAEQAVELGIADRIQS